MTGPEVIVRKFLCAGERLFDNPFEADLGRRIGEERDRVCRRLGARPHIIFDPVAILSNNRFGGMAEVAFARWANVWPMTVFTQFLFYNVKLAGGDLVAVQYNDKRKAAALDVWREELRVKKKREAPDLYVVLTDVIFHPRGEVSFAFVGWTTHAKLLDRESETLKDHPPRWVQDDLCDRLDILTCARGQGYRHGAAPGSFDFGEAV